MKRKITTGKAKRHKCVRCSQRHSQSVSFDLLDLSRDLFERASALLSRTLTMRTSRSLKGSPASSSWFQLRYYTANTCIFPYVYIYIYIFFFYLYIYVYICIYVSIYPSIYVYIHMYRYKGDAKSERNGIAGHIDGAVPPGIDEDEKLSATHRLKLVSDVACCCSLLI